MKILSETRKKLKHLWDKWCFFTPVPLFLLMAMVGYLSDQAEAGDEAFRLQIDYWQEIYIARVDSLEETDIYEGIIDNYRGIINALAVMENYLDGIDALLEYGPPE